MDQPQKKAAQKQVSPGAAAATIVSIQVVLLVLASVGIRNTAAGEELRTAFSLAEVFVGVLAGIVSYAVLLGLVRTDWWLMRSLREQAAKFRSTLGEFSYFLIIIVSAAAAIGEEAFFRVFLQSWVGTFTPTVVAIVVGAVAFGLAHANALSYFLLTFALGLALGSVYAVTNSIALIVAWHFTYDVLSLAVINKYPSLLKIEERAEEA